MITVDVPTGNSLVAMFRNIIPAQPVGVTITRLQRDESPTFNTQQVIFRGELQGVAFANDGLTAQLALLPAEGKLKRTLPSWTYSHQCNHLLYATGCGAAIASFTHTGTVTAVSGNTITVSGASGSGHDFTGGFVKPTTSDDRRLIRSQSGDVLTLLQPFPSDVNGLSVDVSAGCDHLISGDCETVFGRGIDNGGFPYIPGESRNPFGPGGID
jgi:hypothetical protein